jgi:hypothetical protein
MRNRSLAVRRRVGPTLPLAHTVDGALVGPGLSRTLGTCCSPRPIE